MTWNNPVVNPYAAPSRQSEPAQQWLGLDRDALVHAWVLTFRTFLVIAFIVCGSAVILAGMFNAAIDAGALSAILCVVSLIACPPTFVARFLEFRSAPQPRQQ